jgi:parvulin-like peptidyl-prolyl isomerase
MTKRTRSAAWLLAASFVFGIGILLVWRSPVAREFRENQAAADDGMPSSSQIDRALSQRLWASGKSLETLSPAQREAERQAALEDLIALGKLRDQARQAVPPILISPAEIDSRLERFSRRFDSQASLQAAMESQGIPTLADLRARLADQILQEKFLTRVTDAVSQVTDAEAREWFSQNAAALALPERLQARHIFLPTLDHPSEEARAKLEEALQFLKSDQQDFATLARDFSEDPATKNRGGELGWMTRQRLPSDLADPLFSLNLHEPQLIQSHLGWHLIEVTARKPAEARSYAETKPEIIVALQATKRKQALDTLAR